MSEPAEVDDYPLPELTPEFEWRTRSEKMRVVEYWWTEQKAICCICDTEMEPYRRSDDTSPMAASIEHLIPRREGGPNTLGNVRLAHAMCNHALGDLWAINTMLERKGLPPMTKEWALGRTREQWEIRQMRKAAARDGLPVPPMPALKYHLPAITPIVLARANHARVTGYSTDSLAHARNRKKAPLHGSAVLGVPRGATLPGYTPPTDAPPARQALAPPLTSLLSARRPICGRCGSWDVVRDASLRWDRAKGWVIAEYRDGWDCRPCDDTTEIEWETVR